MSPSSPTLVGVPSRAYYISRPDPWIVETKPVARTTRVPRTKFIERQVVQAWKRVTGATRRPQQASFLPKDFVLVTSRRRSLMFR